MYLKLKVSGAALALFTDTAQKRGGGANCRISYENGVLAMKATSRDARPVGADFAAIEMFTKDATAHAGSSPFTAIEGVQPGTYSFAPGQRSWNTLTADPAGCVSLIEVAPADVPAVIPAARGRKPGSKNKPKEA